MTSADAFIRHDSTNTNEGANIRLRVGIGPISRTVVQFDQGALASRVQCGIGTVQLILTIANNHNTWGQTDDHAVSAHPLEETFTEGDGTQALMPPDRVQRGDGPGVTWRSPNDPDVEDKHGPRNKNIWTNATRWNGGSYGPATAAPVTHVNLQDGTVSFDVTADVLAGAVGWLLKIDDERDPDQPRGTGNERFAGVIEYHSVQGAQELGDMNLAPRLRFL